VCLISPTGIFNKYSEHVKSAGICLVHAENTHAQIYTHSNKTIQTNVKCKLYVHYLKNKHDKSFISYCC
jgi:hypothetical protein